MKYRVTFTDPNTQMERPVQMLKNSWTEVLAWRDKMLASGGPDSFVKTYETAETLIAMNRKPSESKPEPEEAA